MDNTTVKALISDGKYQEALYHLVDDIKNQCVTKFKEQNSNLNFDPTLEQLYFLTNAKSQINNITGMVIEILSSDDTIEEKVKLLIEKYDWAVESLLKA